ncbi:MAG TPA: glycosyltransferase, partial [Candidatus Dormibacteraeota bacterium]
GAALVWPTATPLDSVVPGFALFELGLIDLILVLGGTAAVAIACRGPASGARTALVTGRRSFRPRPGPGQHVVAMASRYPVGSVGGVERVATALAARLDGHDGAWLAAPVSAFAGPRGLARLPFIGDLVAALVLALRTVRLGDVLVVHGAEYAWAPLAVGRLTRRPTVVVWHGVRALEALPPSKIVVVRLAHSLFGWASGRLQGVALSAGSTVAVSPTVALEIRREFSFAGRIDVIPNGVSLPDEQVRAASLGARVKGHGAQPKSRQLRAVWIGTSAYRKGLDIALAAVARARSCGLDVSLTVIGLEGRGAGQGAPAPASSGVAYAGRVAPEEVGRVLAQSDVLLSPTRYEPFGMAVFEALALGLPVIGSPAIAWQVGPAGEIVADEDPEQYRAALARLAKPEARARLARLALERARQFSWEAAVASYCRVLDEAVATRPSRTVLAGPDPAMVSRDAG